MTTNLTSLYDDYTDAVRTVQELENLGIPHSDLSIVANHAASGYTEESNAGAGAGAGATVGAALGGGAGLLAGLGMLAIPGVGPVVAAGWLVATAAGVVAGGGVGAATGGIIGSMTSAGVDERHAHVYAEGVRRGGTLVTARVAEDQVPAAEAIMDRNHPVDPVARGRAYQDAGWTTFDERAAPYTEAEVERERALYPRDRVL